MAKVAHHRHFACIAQAEEHSERERIEEAATGDPGEHIARGCALGALFEWTPAHWAQVDAQADGQLEIARRRLALSLRKTL